MMKLLLSTCFLLCSLLSGVAQTQPGKSYQELVSLLKHSKPDTNRILLLQELGSYYISNPDTLVMALDSAVSISQRIENLSLALKYPKGQANSYLLFSRIYNRQGKADKGKEFIKKAIQIFSTYHYLDELGEAYFELGSYYALYGPEMNERIRLSELALSTFQQGGNILKEADCNKELGDLYQINGDNFKALATLKLSLKLYQSIGYPQLHPKLQGVYDLLGTTSCSMSDYKEAVRYGLLAAQAAEQLNDTTMQLATIYNRLGITYFYLKEFEQASAYYNKSIEIAKKYNDSKTVHLLASNIAVTLNRLNRPLEALTFLQDIVKKYPVMAINSRVNITCNFVEIYMILKQYNMAEQYCDRLLELAENPQLIDKQSQRYIYKSLIKFSLATQQYNQAEKYLLAHKFLAEKDGSLFLLSSNHLLWFQLDSAQGNYQSAIVHYQQYKILNDSLFNEAKSKQIALLQIQYDTQKKDQDIKLKEQDIQLLTKHGLLQQTQLRQSNLIKNVTFGSIALLLTIVGLLHNRYRLKQRSSKKLEAQQKEINDKNISLQHLVTEKEWLLKEIHHRVKNNLQIVMSLLNSQSAYLDNDAAMLAIRDSQHRVQAISLIHQKLYQSENLSAIDMQAYIRELVEYLRDFFDTGQRIRFDTQIDLVKLDVSYAVPIGLILNEAITNGIKYAFPRSREGIVTISFKHINGDHYLLTIADNGVGLPAHFDSQQNNSLGMSLMRGLSEDIDGTFTIDNHQGTVISIDFVYEPTIKHGSAPITSMIPLENSAL